MAMLFIGEPERDKIAKIVAYAKAHPLPLDELRKGAVSSDMDVDMDVVELKDRKPGYERPPSQHVIFPGGYRAAFSIEEQPAGLCTHLSISVFGRIEKGKMPSPQAAALIAEAFGVPFPADKMWSEEFDPGEYAINLLSLYAPKQEGRA